MKINNVKVICGAPCGSTWWMAQHLKGVPVSEAPAWGGLLVQQYPCRVIRADPDTVYKYTSKGNFVAVVTDGSAVLGLGNIGAAAAMPVMEGKSILFKNLGGIDAFPNTAQ